MNIFSCPFESKEEYQNNSIDGKDEKARYPFKRVDLFTLHQISFAIELAISTFFETTKNNEIIYEVDFENDRVKEIHTNYNGEPESWGWQANVNEQLSKVKPISNIVIRDEQDIYNILTNREKLELLLEEYQKNQLEEQEVCCDKNTLCVPTNPDIDNSNNKKIASATTITEPLASTRKIGQQIQNEQDYSHTGENRHSKKIEELNREQQILLKDNQEAIIDFLLDNIDSIRVEDCKIYEPIYKCYREKVNCHICNSSSNIICKNCNYSYHSHYNNKEVMLCINHWKQHAIENHIKQLIK
jgi:hypothetical protein